MLNCNGERRLCRPQPRPLGGRLGTQSAGATQNSFEDDAKRLDCERFAEPFTCTYCCLPL